MKTKSKLQALNALAKRTRATIDTEYGKHFVLHRRITTIVNTTEELIDKVDSIEPKKFIKE